MVGWLAYLTAMLGFTAYVGPTVALAGAGAARRGSGSPGAAACIDALRAPAALIAAEELAFLVVFGAGDVRPGVQRRHHRPGEVHGLRVRERPAAHHRPARPRTCGWPANAMPYYYLGYLLVGLPAKIAATPGPMAYSLAMVLVFASGFGGGALDRVRAGRASALPGDVRPSRRRPAARRPAALAAGLLGGTLTMVVGNLVGALS